MHSKVLTWLSCCHSNLSSCNITLGSFLHSSYCIYPTVPSFKYFYRVFCVSTVPSVGSLSHSPPPQCGSSFMSTSVDLRGTRGRSSQMTSCLMSWNARRYTGANSNRQNNTSDTNDQTINNSSSKCNGVKYKEELQHKCSYTMATCDYQSNRTVDNYHTVETIINTSNDANNATSNNVNKYDVCSGDSKTTINRFSTFDNTTNKFTTSETTIDTCNSIGDMVDNFFAKTTDSRSNMIITKSSISTKRKKYSSGILLEHSNVLCSLFVNRKKIFHCALRDLNSVYKRALSTTTQCKNTFNNQKTFYSTRVSTTEEKPAIITSNNDKSLPLQQQQQEETASATTTVGELMKRWHEQLDREGVPEALLSVQHIMAHVLSLNRGELDSCSGTALTAAQQEQLERLLLCRINRMPVQYIIGEWDFRQLTLHLRPPVFIPRPETEELVEATLAVLATISPHTATAILHQQQQLPHHATVNSYHHKPRASGVSDACPVIVGGSGGGSQQNNAVIQDEVNVEPGEQLVIRVLEICCGSGAISLSLLHENKQVSCVAVDRSVAAVTLTTHNAQRLGLTERLNVVQGTVTATEMPPLPHSRYDLVVANPPYVLRKDLKDMPPEITLYEDLRALDGGLDGMAVVKAVATQAGRLLHPGGHLMIEVDPCHRHLLPAWLSGEGASTGLRLHRVLQDFRGKDRFLHLVKVSAEAPRDATISQHHCRGRDALDTN